MPKIHFEYSPVFKILADAVKQTNGSKDIKSIKSPIQIFELSKESSTAFSLSDLGHVSPSLLEVWDEVRTNLTDSLSYF